MKIATTYFMPSLRTYAMNWNGHYHQQSIRSLTPNLNLLLLNHLQRPNLRPSHLKLHNHTGLLPSHLLPSHLLEITFHKLLAQHQQLGLKSSQAN
jgi:hypothetical protein